MLWPPPTASPSDIRKRTPPPIPPPAPLHLHGPIRHRPYASTRPNFPVHEWAAGPSDSQPDEREALIYSKRHKRAAIAASRTPLWPALGWGCRGRRLSTG